MVGRRTRRWAALVSAAALAGGLVAGAAAPAQAGPAQARPAAGPRAQLQTADPAAEARKLDAIPAPKLRWWACYGTAQCATVKVPRDYDRPHGAKVELALLRVKARNPKQRIGSLFVNPGGPGGQATLLALAADQFLAPQILDRFDIVGMDPRGVGFSDNVRCFDSVAAQTAVFAPYTRGFPVTPKQEAAWIRSTKAFGAACTKAGGLALSMSTAEVARDMELMRRSVGDRQLTYFGFSYGSYLGQVYANLFPDRFRALAIDGVLDPQRWAGTPAYADDALGDRLRSADGA